MNSRERLLAALDFKPVDRLPKDLGGMRSTGISAFAYPKLRKALKLFRRSNGPLLEWLSSPLIYREKGSTANRLRKLAPDLFSPIALWHHYRGLMEKSRVRYQTESSTIKTWFYMLRPFLCMRWIELGHGIPPMRFDHVLETVVADADLKGEIQNLVNRKRCGDEKDRFAPPPSVAKYVDETIRTMTEPPARVSARQKSELDSIFREAIECWRTFA